MAQGIKHNTLEDLTNALIALIFPNKKKLITGSNAQQALLDLAESLWDQGGFVNVNIDDSAAQFLEDKLIAGAGITLSVIDNAGTKTIEIASNTVSQDELVKIQADDTTSEYLGDKIVAGTNVTINVLDNAGVKTLEISASGGESVTPTNGLQDISGDIGLGSPLTEPTTTIDASDNNLTILNGGNITIEGGDGANAGGSGLYITPTTIAIAGGFSGDFNSITCSSNTSTPIEVDSIGLQYDTGYVPSALVTSNSDWIPNSGYSHRETIKFGDFFNNASRAQITDTTYWYKIQADSNRERYISRFALANGATGAVNQTVSIGVYDSLGTTQISTGSMTLGTQIQTYYGSFTEVMLDPNTEYWIGLHFDNETTAANLMRFNMFSTSTDLLREQTSTVSLPATLGGGPANDAPILTIY